MRATARGLLALVVLWPSGVLATDCATPPLRAPAEEWMILVREYAGHAGITQDVLRTADGFSVPLEMLHDWRIAPAGTPQRFQGRDWYPLSSISGLTQRFDACNQVLELDFARVQRAAQVRSLQTGLIPLSAIADAGGFINLDFLFSSSAGRRDTAASFEADAFSDLGRMSHTLLIRNGHPVKLDSFVLREDPGSMTTFRLGDSITHPGSWGRAARFIGVQWGTDFSLQPYFATFPQPVIRGDAILPSSLDVFVNGQRRGSQQTDPGPFELRDIPTLSGSGEALLVVRDNLGRESTISQPFYVSPTLLRPGLRDYALEAGALRRNYGVESIDYGAVFAAGTLRQGLRENLTGELRAEFQADRAAVGASSVWLIGQLGLLSTSAIYGLDRQGGGWQGSVGIERDVPGRYSLALRSQWTEPGFNQLGQTQGQPPARRLDLARFSVQPHAFGVPGNGTLSFLWTREESRTAADVELRAVGYGMQVGPRGFLNLGYTETCAPDCQPSARLDFTWSFGGQVSATVQHEHSGASDVSRASLQRNSAGSLGLDWRASVERGGYSDDPRGSVSAAWKTERGTFTTDLVHDADLSYRVGAATGIAFLGREAFWTRPVNGSFAVVRTNGLADVGITADGRPVGRTDAAGDALIPDLRAYEINRLSLVVEDIPIESDLPRMTLDLVPRGRSGLFADFAAPPETGP